MKVAFNASQLLSPLTGIGQYTLNLGSALGTLNEVDLEFFYATCVEPRLEGDSLKTHGVSQAAGQTMAAVSV